MSLRVSSSDDDDIRPAHPASPGNHSWVHDFVHLDGSRILVAQSPEHANTLNSKNDSGSNCQVVVHGSQEHCNILYSLQQHFSTFRKYLIEKHGDVCSEMEHALLSEQSVKSQLERLEPRDSRHRASTFSKYGYHKDIRIDGHGDEQNLSSLEKLNTVNWDKKHREGKYFTFLIRPIARQYFYNGLIWRAQDVEEVAAYELFFDLIYVGIIAVCGDFLAHNTSFQSLDEFCIAFIMGWRIWSDVTLLMNRFDQDDFARRILIVTWLASLIAFATNVDGFFCNMLVGTFLVARGIVAAYNIALAFAAPVVKHAMFATSVGIRASMPIWIASLFQDDIRKHVALPWVAIAVDLFMPGLLVCLHHGFVPFGSRARRFISNGFFRGFPAMNIEHKVNRTGCFVTLILGYSVVSLIFQSSNKVGLTPFFGKAVLGLIQAIVFNWLYFEVDSYNLHTHAIRRQAISAFLWDSLHLPFILSFVVGASSLSMIVLVHDLRSTNVHSLSDSWMEDSANIVEPMHRWRYCVGYSIALTCMTGISMCHVHKQCPRTHRWTPCFRWVFRFVVSGILIAMPAATNTLDSLSLEFVVTALLVAILAVELATRSRVLFFDSATKNIQDTATEMASKLETVREEAVR